MRTNMQAPVTSAPVTVTIKAPPVPVLNAASFTGKAGIGAAIDASASLCANAPCTVELGWAGAREGGLMAGCRFC